MMQDFKGITQQMKLIFTHPAIGEHQFPAFKYQLLGDFRIGLDISSQTYLFTNYYFQHKGMKVNEFDPVMAISEQKQATIDIVFMPYEYRSAKHHFHAVIDVLSNPQNYIFLFKAYEQENEIKKNDSGSLPIPIDTSEIDLQNMKPDLKNKYLVSELEREKKVNFLISISLSGFNPPPPKQKFNGDLFYIHVRTLEGQDLHITASPQGFYLNQSKISMFNPNKSLIYRDVYFSLLDLFQDTSQKFRQKIESLYNEVKLNRFIKYTLNSIDKIKKIHWLEFLDQEHGWHQRKCQDQQLNRSQLLCLKDWNQVLHYHEKMQQLYSEECRPESQATFCKIYEQFEKVAIEGAIAFIDGKITPLNQGDEKKKHICIYNKMFFSIANETIYDRSQVRNDEATPTSSTFNTDIINIQIVQKLKIPQLHILHMIMVNYRGFNVIAQSIIPGILTIDQSYCSQFGSVDNKKTIQVNPQFEKIMIEVCHRLGIEQNIEAIDGNGNKTKIACSPDIKGILGTDKKKYFMDLYRLSPRDLNYEGENNQSCVIRPELIRNFRKSKGNQKLAKINVNIGTSVIFEKGENYDEQYELLKEMAAYLRKDAIDSVIELLKNSPSQYLTNNQGITRAFHLHGVNMRYLGEVCNHEKVKNQRQIKLVLQRAILIRSVKHYLRMVMRESNILHVGTVVVNILNCIFGRKAHIQKMEQKSTIDQNKVVEVEEVRKEGKKKKKNKSKEQNGPIEGCRVIPKMQIKKIAMSKYATIKPKQVWKQISEISKARFNYILAESQLQFEPFKFPFQKIAILREVCFSIGLILQRKNYDIFDGFNQQNSNENNILPFEIGNIVNIVPRSKRIKIQPQNLVERERQSQKLIEKYQVKEALRLDSELQKQNLVMYGGQSETLIKLYTRMGKILFILGETKSAIAQEQKNLSLLQSIYCQDNWLNIQTHINLGVYYITWNDKKRVVYYMNKGIYLMLITFGETSPDLLVCLANLARIYQINKQYNQAIKCYQVAMKFMEQVHGKFHVQVSFCQASLASIYYEMSDMKSAIEHQTQNVAILNKILPDTDPKFQDALKILKIYREMNQKSQNQNNNTIVNSILSPTLTKVDQPKKIQKEKEVKEKNKKNKKG